MVVVGTNLVSPTTSSDSGGGWYHQHVMVLVVGTTCQWWMWWWWYHLPVVDMMLRLLRADMGALVVDTATCVAAEICTIVYHLGGHNNNPLLNSIWITIHQELLGEYSVNLNFSTLARHGRFAELRKRRLQPSRGSSQDVQSSRGAAMQCSPL